jgi:phage gp36-like protein
MSYYVTLQEVREQAGFQYKTRSEDLDPSTGDGTNKIFYAPNKPLVDRNYSGTPVGTPDVVVYENDVEVTVLSIDGALGKLTLSSTPESGTPMTVDCDWSNIEDVIVESYLAEAHDLINSKVGERYSLPLSETPNLVKLIEKKLAAGLLLDKEYSVGGDETEDTRGRRWIKWAEQKLEDIVSGSLELRDSSGNVLSQKTAVGIDGWPDDTTDGADIDDAGDKGPNVRITDEF